MNTGACYFALEHLARAAFTSTRIWLLKRVDDEVCEDSPRLKHWPEIVLQRYCEGRLDALADEMPALHSLLEVLAKHGHAIRANGSWHPLHAVEDEYLNKVVLRRLNAADVDPPSKT